ncbi:MAG TPA: hypothetical protein VNM91_05820 [Dehalococcoidia bacterium]|nr:hypothetical protein [Dehalococcoidia bacterium]
MYGSVFRMKPAAGKRQELIDLMTAPDDRRPPGMVAAYLLAEDKDDAVWVMAVFEDEQSYRKNAQDPSQDEEYRRWRALLDADPEWHDGTIMQAPA